MESKSIPKNKEKEETARVLQCFVAERVEFCRRSEELPMNYCLVTLSSCVNATECRLFLSWAVAIAVAFLVS